jgi:hypothetical protein
MSIEASYADMPLVFPTQEILEFSRLKGMFDPEDYLRDIAVRVPDGIDTYNYNALSYLSKMELGSLYWPTGASRFGCGFFLTTSEYLEKLPGFDVGGNADSEDSLGGIRNRVQGEVPNRAKGYKPHYLKIKTSSEYGKALSMRMWMLPPRPLFQRLDENLLASNEVVARFPFPHKNSLWVLPLVDDRYWWWWHTTGTFKLSTCTTWRDLYLEVFKRIGYDTSEIDIKSTAFLEDYLFPHEILRKQSNGFRVPVFLDLLCQSTNGRISLTYDGKVRVTEAYQDFLEFTAGDDSATAGGRGNLASMNLKESRENPSYPDGAEILSNIDAYNRLLTKVKDSGGIIPSVVTFYVGGQPYRVLTTQEDLPMVEENTQHTTTNQLFTRNAREGRLRYFEREDGEKFPPTRAQDIPKVFDGVGQVNDPFENGDFVFDTKNNLLYGPKSLLWGEGKAGYSILSKNFRIQASSYKEKQNYCSSLYRKPAGVSDKEFSVAQLKTFFKKFTKDWIYRQLPDQDVVSAGIVPVRLNGNHDHVLWNLNENTSTKVVRAPYNDLAEDIFIECYLGTVGCTSDAYPCGQCKGMQGDSTTTQLYGFGTSDMFLPYSAILEKTKTVLPNDTALTYSHWHKPPYVVKFCLGESVGTVALDYHFQTSMSVTVYWNGEKVASRKVYGSKSFTCQSGSQSWGRLTFYKTEKSPTYALVIVDALADTFSQQEAERPQAMNWYLNMRCVDSIPYPAPRAIACDSKLNEVGGVFTLGMFTSIPVNIEGTSNGIIPNTPICISDAVDSSFPCAGTGCTIPAKLLLKFQGVGETCPFLKDLVIPLQKSTTEGGWVGITDEFGSAQDILQARLSMIGTSSFTLVLKDILNLNKPAVTLSNITTCLCDPFQLTIPNVDLTAFSCAPENPNPLQILITEA